MAKKLFWLLVVFLLFGLIVLSSASAVQATKQFGSSSYYWRHQMVFGVLPGLVLMLALWRVPYRRLRFFAFPLMGLALVLMGMVFVPGFGLHLKGATSWLTLGPVTFQPAEFLKLALVVYLAAWLSPGKERVKTWQSGILPFVLIIAVVAGLLLFQPDLGTLGIVAIIAGGMYFVAGLSYRRTFAIMLILAILGTGFAALLPHRWQRITTIFHPARDVRGSGWQLNQSLIAIGSGGIWGVGLGQSTQKFGFLPEPIGDSIFAILSEELGLVGGIGTVLLFIVLALMLVRIARNAPDPFGALLTAGMGIWIMAQALVNMTAVTGLGPFTGLPLPFISYGGTSMIAMLAGLGIVLNVADRA